MKPSWKPFSWTPLPDGHNSQVRGRYMQIFIGVVKKLPIDEREAIREAGGVDYWRAIERSGPFTWLPVDVNLSYTHAVTSCLGVSETKHFFRMLWDYVVTHRLFIFMQTIGKLSRIGVPDYLKWLDRCYNLSFRNSGHFEIDYVDTDAQRPNAHIALTNLPDVLVSDFVWLQSVASAVHFVYGLAQCDGTVLLLEREPNLGRATFEMSWSRNRIGQPDPADADRPRA